MVQINNDNDYEDISVERLTREQFVKEVFGPHYQAGEHVTFIGPTQSGKTTIAYELLDEVASPDLIAVVLVMKPKDQTVVDWTKLAGFKKIESWPPVTKRGIINMNKSGGSFKKRRGFVFWPRHSLKDIERDDEMLSREFKKVLSQCYGQGNKIIFADEIVGLSKELGLSKQLEAIWMRGSSLKCGLWAATQRPFHAPLLMYSMAEHLILFRDPDRRDIQRFKEIGGVDPDIVENTMYKLKKFEFLYIGRTMGKDGVSPALAIVGAE